MKKPLIILLLFSQHVLFAQYFEELMPTGTPNTWWDSPMCDTAFGKLYFQSVLGQSNCPWYVTDETPAAIYPVWNHNTGNTFFLTREHVFYNGKAIYCGVDSIHGNELWQSDGTDTGSHLIKDLNPVASSFPNKFRLYNNRVYFDAKIDNYYDGLWSTDGTDTGTHLLKQFHGGWSTNLEVVFKNKLWFVPNDLATGLEVWYTDGTVAGTQLLKDINPTGSAYPSAFCIMDSLLFFDAEDTFGLGGNNKELWKTDGTTAGTVMVKEINPLRETGSGAYPNTTLNGKLFFTADDGLKGSELWVTDGTAAGTHLLKDIYPGTVSGGVSFGAAPPDNRFLVYNNLLHFLGDDNTGLYQLWTSDGTLAGTNKVISATGTPVRNPRYMAEWKGKLYFTAYDENNWSQMWVSDGTPAGTHKIVPSFTTYFEPVGNSCFRGFYPYKNSLYFAAKFDTTGCQIYKFTDSLVITRVSEMEETPFTLYPNPTGGRLSINSDEPIDELTIISPQGAIIKTVQPVQKSIDLSLLASGIYLLRCRSGEKIFVRRVVVEGR